MPTITTTALCATCSARLARDNHDTICSPCRRQTIESLACRSATTARDRHRIMAELDAGGLRGVASFLECSIAQALDVVVDAQLLPNMSARRRAVVRQLVTLERSSHVAAAQILGISRWTVATYRDRLGLDHMGSPCERSAELSR